MIKHTKLFLLILITSKIFSVDSSSHKERWKMGPKKKTCIEQEQSEGAGDYFLFSEAEALRSIPVKRPVPLPSSSGINLKEPI